jgi:hypothetical protein
VARGLARRGPELVSLVVKSISQRRGADLRSVVSLTIRIRVCILPLGSCNPHPTFSEEGIKMAAKKGAKKPAKKAPAKKAAKKKAKK